MAGNLANEGEELALNHLFRDQTVYLGLATAEVDDDDTLSSITEEDDANYERQEISFSSPAQEGGKGTIKNDSEITFSDWDSDADEEITHAFITDADSGTSGDLLAWIELPKSKQPDAGENMKVPVDDLVQDID